MAEVYIQLGRTDGFRYIGIQPPITDEHHELLRQAHGEVDGLPKFFTIITPHSGEPYSEMSLLADAYLTPDHADTCVIKTAEKLAKVLGASGDTFIIDEGFKPIGYGNDLFGGRSVHDL